MISDQVVNVQDANLQFKQATSARIVEQIKRRFFGKQAELEINPVDYDRNLLIMAVRLTAIQEKYSQAVSDLRNYFGRHIRGCGPSAFSLAVFCQEVVPELEIEAIFDDAVNTSGIRLVFGMANRDGLPIDHAWVEVTHGEQVLVISPESSETTTKADFQMVIVNQGALRHVYKNWNLKRISRAYLEAAMLADDQVEPFAELFNQINNGEVPDDFSYWHQILLTAMNS
jgi:hypothetical protein